MNFWSHVTLCAELCLAETGTVSSFDGGGETEVCNLEVEGLIVEYVLWLQISVGNT